MIFFKKKKSAPPPPAPKKKQSVPKKKEEKEPTPKPSTYVAMDYEEGRHLTAEGYRRRMLKKKS
jgi:hypothetical protein